MTDRRSLPARTPARARWLALLALGLATGASAQTVYKCTDGHGGVRFQDAPCSRHEKQHVLHLHVPAPPSDAHAPPVVPPSPAHTSPAPPKPAPRVVQRTWQIPQLYQCVRATDGKLYVSRNGHPPAYRAPLGILGAFQLPLSQTYGGRNATRRAASDPQLAKGRITPGLVAGHYTWVQDRCRPMGVGEICAHLSAQMEKTQSAIDKAFKSDRPPLERKAAKLRSEMAGCGH